MAHLWLDTGSDWAVIKLTGAAYVVAEQGSVPVRSRTSSAVRSLTSSAVPSRTGEAPGEREALLLRTGAGGWCLIPQGRGHCAWVNGDPLLLGIRALQDRDEIRLGGAHMFLSTERPAAVEPFPGADRQMFCARCKAEIECGCPAVRCPGCGVWHHQDGTRPCWSYAPHCALCGEPTDIEGYRWTPEDL